jgi:serine protease
MHTLLPAVSARRLMVPLLFVAALAAAPSARAERWLVRTGAERLSAQRIVRADEAPRLVHEFRHIPFAAVEGTEAQVRRLQQAGLIVDYEPDLVRHMLEGTGRRPEMRAAAFPWVIAAGALLALAACGGDDDDDDKGSGPPQRADWGVQKIRALQAHQFSRGRGVKVSVIDSGIDADHPDLRVVAGKNFVRTEQPPGPVEWDDCIGHGTHVAGIIAARDNNIGTIGVAPEAELYAARVFPCDPDSGAFTSDIIAAIDWSIEQRVHVINLSLGGPGRSVAEELAVNRAAAAGIVVIAASGNDSSPGLPAPIIYPAAFESVVAVGATDEADVIGGFSNQGPEQELSAPGIDVLATVLVGSAAVATLEQGSRQFNTRGFTFSGKGQVDGQLFHCGRALRASDCPSGVRGHVALVERGQNFFSEKVQNAMNAGARAVVVYNHTEDGGALFGGTLQTAGAWVPSVSVSNADGLALRALGDGVRVRVAVVDSDYDFSTGTSMASPHVAGVAALIIAAQGGLSVNAIRQRLRQGAVDLGRAGRDALYGYGRIDALGALGRAKASSGAHAEPAAPGAAAPSVGEEPARR